MKRFILRIISALLIISLFSFSLPGCYGKFNLSKKLYSWNGQVGDKWANSAVTWILIIVQVYTISGIVDFVFLNLIEFWTGSNPVSMGPNDKETQLVKHNDKMYEITATQNRFDIKELNDDHAAKIISLIFDSQTKSWSVQRPLLQRMTTRRLQT